MDMTETDLYLTKENLTKLLCLTVIRFNEGHRDMKGTEHKVWINLRVLYHGEVRRKTYREK